ncbi:hypothetical protein F183_A23150 [Bryobacterales bacterium F-183]|nr:hypothetical protein F183_A23150 [Bryobacterales bacterium F-183]
MGHPVLTARQINRTLLARQFLLQPPQPAAIPDVVDALAGLQAQQARPPFVGLWTRIANFRREDLHDLLAARTVVRATAMRGTLHLLTMRQYPAFRGALQPALSSGMQSILKDRAATFDLARLTSEASRIIARKPCTFAELRPQLTAAFPDLSDERALGFAVRMHLPLVTVPDAGNLWAFTGDSPFELAPRAGKPKVETDIVLAYLRAFGPATIADFQSWSGLKSGKVLFAAHPDLTRYRDEKKRELFDVPGAAPMLDPDIEVAPRFVAAFDNLILSHVDRSRIIADEYRPRVVTKNLQVLPTFLVDGFVAGTWQTAIVKKQAVLTATPFAKLAKKVQKQLAHEAEGLVRFMEPEAAGYQVDIKLEPAE